MPAAALTDNSWRASFAVHIATARPSIRPPPGASKVVRDSSAATQERPTKAKFLGVRKNRPRRSFWTFLSREVPRQRALSDTI
jgi:hypothetical protein